MKRWIAIVALFLGGLMVTPVIAQQVVRIYGTETGGTFLPVLVDSLGRVLVDLSGGSIEPDRVLLADGTVALPAAAFQNDPDTGWYWTGDGAILMANNGVLTHQWGPTYYANSSNSATIQLGAAGDVSFSRGAADNLAVAAGDSLSIGGAKAAATTATRLIKKVTGIADASATNVVTVTVPNANHAAGIKLSFLSSNGSTDAFESSRVAEGFVVLARTSGVATVATVAALDLAQIATVGGGATHTLAYGVSGMTGAAGAQQTFTIQVTINDSGNVGANQVVVVAEVINAESTGVTIQ